MLHFLFVSKPLSQRLDDGGWGQTESFLLEVPVNAFSQQITCFLTDHAIIFLLFSFSETMLYPASHR